MMIRKPIELPPAVARAFVKEMAAYFIGTVFMSVPELTRSAGIQLNRRLSLWVGSEE
jgi:hypothetical protein